MSKQALRHRRRPITRRNGRSAIDGTERTAEASTLRYVGALTELRKAWDA